MSFLEKPCALGKIRDAKSDMLSLALALSMSTEVMDENEDEIVRRCSRCLFVIFSVDKGLGGDHRAHVAIGNQRYCPEPGALEKAHEIESREFTNID